MRGGIFGLAALLIACATPPETAPSDTTQIAFERRSWGNIQERWTVSADGRAAFEQPPAGARFGTPPEERDYNISHADFQRIQTALAPAERFVTDGLACTHRITDMPYGAVTWRDADGQEREVSFNLGCERTADIDAFFASVREADRIFHDVTGTTEQR